MKEQLLDFLTQETDCERIDGVIVGKLLDINKDGCPLVDFPLNTSHAHLTARTTVALDRQDIGREITLVFEEGDPESPIITGIIQTPKEKTEKVPENDHLLKEEPIDVEIDGEKVTFTAEKEIVLRCGKASITLTRAGKVLIRGTYLLSRSTGVNRVKGGSVELN